MLWASKAGGRRRCGKFRWKMKAAHFSSMTFLSSEHYSPLYLATVGSSVVEKRHWGLRIFNCPTQISNPNSKCMQYIRFIYNPFCVINQTWNLNFKRFSVKSQWHVSQNCKKINHILCSMSVCVCVIYRHTTHQDCLASFESLTFIR